jgi:alkylhydroperoxidase family enzyme
LPRRKNRARLVTSTEEKAMARLKYLGREELLPEHQDLIPDINLSRLLVHSPNAARASRGTAMYIRNGSKLDPKLREMAIIQVGYVARSAYEYAHHIEIGLTAGLSDADIRAIADETAGRPTALDPLTRAALQAARDLTRDIRLSDETFALLHAQLDNERLIDLFYAISIYNSVVRLLAALEVDLEDDYRQYLEKFPLPAG